MLLKGIPVTLHERVQIGKDDFGAPIYEEKPVVVQNVLVSPVTSEDVVSDIQLYGKRAAYELCLPKGDAHYWEDCRVDFFDHSWRVFGLPKEWIETMVPGSWNKKIRVERYE